MESNKEQIDDNNVQTIQAENWFLQNANVTIPVTFDVLNDYMSCFSDIAQQIDDNNLQFDTVKAFLDLLASTGAPAFKASASKA